MNAWRYCLSASVLVMVTALSPPSFGATFRVESGALERQGDLLVARSEGAAVRLSPDVRMLVAPGSRLYRIHKRARLWLSNDGRTSTHLLALERGRLEIENATQGERAVMVRAPHKVAAALRQGRMTVVSTEDGTSVANYEGSVILAVGSGKFRKLPVGSVRTVSDQGERDTPILPATSVQLSQNLFGGFGSKAELSGVSWAPVEGATRYRVQVERTAPEGASRVATVETYQLKLESPPRLAAGRYEVTVVAVDDFGIAGKTSQAVPFSVLGVKTTEGGYVDRRGNIVLGYDRRVQLTYANGLVMKGGPDSWKPVPEEIVLPSDEPMNLHVREAGDTRIVSTRLLAQQVNTTVEVGPKLLRWPGPSAKVRVRIRGEEGSPQPAWLEPRFRVQLGIDEVPVTWERRDGDYVTEVAPRSGKGPWVVRVEVEDQYGHLLGRDFVEIAESSLPKPSDAEAPPAASQSASDPASDQTEPEKKPSEPEPESRSESASEVAG